MASSSKMLLLVVVLFVATVLLVSSDVVARKMTGTTSNTVDPSVKSKGEVNDAKYPYGGTGAAPWWWEPFPGYGGGCCADANQKPDHAAHYKAAVNSLEINDD